MPKTESTRQLPTHMAVQAFLMFTKRPLFGNPYINVGGFETIIGVLYESCAIIGRVFKDDTTTLAQILGFKQNVEQGMSFLKKTADERLKEYRSVVTGRTGPDSIPDLVLVTEYSKLGVVYPIGGWGSKDDYNDYTKGDPDAERFYRNFKIAIRQKVNMSDAGIWKKIETTLFEGFGFGLMYPDLTSELVTKLHTSIDINNNNFKTFIKLSGIVAPRNLATDSPQQAENNALDMVREYINRYRPELTGKVTFKQHGQE